MKQLLTREYFHVPVYAWAAGGIALVVGLLWFMRRGSAAGSTAVAPMTAAPPGYPGVSGSAGLPGAGITGGGNAMATFPPGPGSDFPTATVRGFGALGASIAKAWDAVQGGVPARTAPSNAGNIVGILPWGSQIQVTGQAPGASPIGSGSTTWSQVQLPSGQSGWVWQGDLAPPPAPTTPVLNPSANGTSSLPGGAVPWPNWQGSTIQGVQLAQPGAPPQGTAGILPTGANVPPQSPTWPATRMWGAPALGGG